MAIYNSLKILNQNEFEELFKLPKIDHEDRESLFEITAEDKQYLSKEHELRVKLNYILQIGYFRAKRNFYRFDFHEVKDDAQYILNRYFCRSPIPNKAVIKISITLHSTLLWKCMDTLAIALNLKLN